MKYKNRKISEVGKKDRRSTRQPTAGFALLIAVIFMSVMLALGLELSSIGYKQQVLASSAVESQYAFYVADAAMECALHEDQQKNTFEYPQDGQPAIPPTITCDGLESVPTSISWSLPSASSKYIVKNRLSLDDKYCAEVTVYKYWSPQSPDNRVTDIFSQGYDVPCATVDNPNGARFVSRGLNIHY